MPGVNRKDNGGRKRLDSDALSGRIVVHVFPRAKALGCSLFALRAMLQYADIFSNAEVS